MWLRQLNAACQLVKPGKVCEHNIKMLGHVRKDDLFEPISFDNLNETDIREEILAPLIRALGYRSGTVHNVIREQSLRYPRAFLGRKNSKKDPILRGIADYILEAELSVRWVVEAKAPDVDIDNDAIEQAFTYANHPEIRAVYFALCNGRKLVVYQTNRGPQSAPLLEINYEDFDSKYRSIESLLAPESILRDNPSIEPEIGEPIGEGLRSIVRVTNGLISYHGSSVNIPALREMQISVSSGALERDEEGRLVAFLTTVAPTRSMQNLNQRLGLSSFEMFSPDSRISSNADEPTTFRGEQIITLPAGERLLDINTWREVAIPMNMTCRVIFAATGHLEGHRFHGSFESIMDYQSFNQRISLYGKFEMFVS